MKKMNIQLSRKYLIARHFCPERNIVVGIHAFKFEKNLSRGSCGGGRPVAEKSFAYAHFVHARITPLKYSVLVSPLEVFLWATPCGLSTNYRWYENHRTRCSSKLQNSSHK